VGGADLLVQVHVRRLFCQVLHAELGLMLVYVVYLVIYEYTL